MKTLDAQQVQTDFDRLIEEVAQGQTIKITRDGYPVAFLVSAKDYQAMRALHADKTGQSDPS